jgi:crooked neck
LDLDSARKVYGQAMGRCPRTKILISYSQLELKLGNLERCRKINEKMVELFPHLVESWVFYANFENDLEEVDRARSIYDMAIQQITLSEEGLD